MMRRFHFLIIAAVLLCPSAYAADAETIYDAPKGDPTCYDRQGMAKPDTSCVCMVQKYACGPASTCGSRICKTADCESDKDCADRFGPSYHCQSHQCKTN